MMKGFLDIYVGALPFVAGGALVASAIKVYQKRETPLESAVFSGIATLAWPVVLPALAIAEVRYHLTGQRGTLTISWKEERVSNVE